MNDLELHMKIHETILQNQEIAEGIFKNLNEANKSLLNCITMLEERVKTIETNVEHITAEKGEDQFVQRHQRH